MKSVEAWIGGFGSGLIISGVFIATDIIPSVYFIFLGAGIILISSSYGLYRGYQLKKEYAEKRGKP